MQTIAVRSAPDFILRTISRPVPVLKWERPRYLAPQGVQGIVCGCGLKVLALR